jgi:transposase
MEIDRLKQEVHRLKAQQRYQDRKGTEAPFGSSTPSAKIPIKPNSLEENQNKKGGAKQGHVGHGRRPPAPPDITRTEQVMAPEVCPECGSKLSSKGFKKRTVIEVVPVRKEIITYELEQCDCPRCHRTFSARAPGVFPKGLFGNRLLAHVALEHYVHGITLGRLSRQLGIQRGSLLGAMHQLGRRLLPIMDKLVQQYRHAPVKHADETGWRNDGQNGYAWLFCTALISVFRFRQSRSAQIALEVFGQKLLRGTLVVDRYRGYHKVLCPMQYCYAHLLREVKDLAKEFESQSEVQGFVQKLATLLAQAMKLRTQGLTLKAFLRQARQIKAQIIQTTQAPAQHPGIQKIQNIFRENAKRLYRWARHPSIPAENNRAERELRPLVIARKISFGSQSKKGLQTREVLMSVLHTLSKQAKDPFDTLCRGLDALALNPTLDPYELIFNSS